MAEVLGRAEVIFGANDDELQKVAKGVSRQVNATANRVNGSLDGMTGRFNSVGQSAQTGLGGISGGLGRVAAAAGPAVAAIASVGAAFLALRGVATAAGKAIREGIDFETTTIQFETLLKSAEQAQLLLQELTDFSATTPFQLPGLLAASRQLLAFQFAASEIRPILTDLGNIAALTGADLSDLAQILGRVKSGGRVTAEELNRLTDRGIPILSALSESLGVAEKDVRKLVSAGTVGFKDFEDALRGLGQEGGTFAGGIDRLAASTAGAFSTLKDNVGLAFRDVGSVILEELNLAAVIQDATKTVQGILPEIIQIARAGAEALKPFIEFFLENLPTAIAVAIGVIKGVIGVWNALKITVIAGALAIVKAVGAIAKSLEFVTNLIPGLSTDIGSFLDELGDGLAEQIGNIRDQNDRLFADAVPTADASGLLEGADEDVEGIKQSFLSLGGVVGNVQTDIDKLKSGFTFDEASGRVVAIANGFQLTGAQALKAGAKVDDVTKTLITYEDQLRRVGETALVAFQRQLQAQGATDDQIRAAVGLFKQLENAQGVQSSEEALSKLAGEVEKLQAIAKDPALAALFKTFGDDALVTDEQIERAKKLNEELAALKGQEAGAAAIQKLQDELLKLTQTEGQLLEIQLRRNGATEEQIKQAQALQEKIAATSKAQKEANDEEKKARKEAESTAKALESAAKRVFDATRTPAEKFTEQLTELKELFAAGLIDQDTFDRASDSAKASLKEAQDAAANAADNANEARQASFVGLQDAFDNLQKAALTTSAGADDANLGAATERAAAASEKTADEAEKTTEAVDSQTTVLASKLDDVIAGQVATYA